MKVLQDVRGTWEHYYRERNHQGFDTELIAVLPSLAANGCVSYGWQAGEGCP